MCGRYGAPLFRAYVRHLQHGTHSIPYDGMALSRESPAKNIAKLQNACTLSIRLPEGVLK
ncbi:hypothetical protein LDC_2122 [sediment metagenome]|uniref:Uncharacterized protein n=1 Tax=sediment metagenome TaxID=749907 RepID=D9PKQ3_9ZZZZ